MSVRRTLHAARLTLFTAAIASSFATGCDRGITPPSAPAAPPLSPAHVVPRAIEGDTLQCREGWHIVNGWYVCNGEG